ncbi:MAG: M1 family aminopeptidase, partial [Chitinophagales bacterium]
VHEMAHQWFGDKITCASWRDIWLNEGFATYSTWLSYDFSEDPNNYYEGWLNGTRNVVVSQPGGSVWVDDTTLVSRIFDGRLSYYKGGWLLHMLRKQLGDEDFFQGIKNYITDADLSYGFVTTTDLVQHLESAADTSLSEFFNDWFYGEGFPTYHVLWTQDDNGFVTIALSQSTSHPSVDFFEMDVPLRIKGENDSLDIHLKHAQNGQLFSVPIPFEANAVILDPAIELLHGESIVTKTELLENTVQLVVYPTLVQDKINVQLFALTEDEYEIMIYSGSADLVMQSKFVADSQTAKFEIDVTTWPSGLYVIVVKNGSTDIVQKVIIL